MWAGLTDSMLNCWLCDSKNGVELHPNALKFSITGTLTVSKPQSQTILLGTYLSIFM